ncbi:MAG: type I-B CRISPR-associated endonuclease Cas1b [bacterium]
MKPLTRPYYIFSAGRLRRRENTICFEKEDTKTYIPVEDVKEIFIFSEVDLNSRLLNFLAQNGVVVHFFNYYGFYTGSFFPRQPQVSGHLLVQQVLNYIDKEKRLRIAKEIVNAALFNLKSNVLYYRKKEERLKEVVKGIEEEMGKVWQVEEIEELMGVEGRARDKYYSAFNDILKIEVGDFKRVRRPPDNMVNALISFGNSLLYSAILSEIYTTQLNPTISYLHEPSQRRFSLALDISEVFKPIYVDRLIFRIINKGMMSEKDFLEEVGLTYLNEEGRKKFIKEFDEMLARSIKHKRLNRYVSYRQLLRLECYKLIRHLSGMEEYKAFKVWW